MYSRTLCDKCKLTIYAPTKKALKAMAKKVRCRCNDPPPQKRERDIWRGRHSLSKRSNYYAYLAIERFIKINEDTLEDNL